MAGLDAIDLELLRAFVVTAGSPTFAEAARRRGLSTSAISQQMKRLEGQLGVALFERAGRRALLTDEGQALLEALGEPIERIEEAVEAALTARRSVRGRVRLGAPRTFAASWLRPRLPALLAAWPELRLEVDFAPPERLERRLVEGELDLALLVRPPREPGLEAEPVYTGTWVAAAAPGWLEQVGDPQGEQAFRRLAWLAFDRDRSLLGPWWRAAFGGPPPQRVVCQVRSIEELRALAEAGLGAAVLPDYVATPAVQTGRLRLLETGAREARFVVHLAWRRGAADTARRRAVQQALSAQAASEPVSSSERA